MRELKFRVWDEYTEEYLDVSKGMNDGLVGVAADGDSILFLEDGQVQKYRVYDEAVYDDNGEEIFKKEDVYIVEQYTGLKDKNGKEIYEGDIVSVHNKNHKNEYDIGAVEFGKAAFRCPFLLGKYHSGQLEVIGNIHENQDLLGDTNVTNRGEEFRTYLP